MNLQESAAALATAIAGVGPEEPAPRGPEESLAAVRWRIRQHNHRKEIEAALVAFGEACAAKGAER